MIRTSNVILSLAIFCVSLGHVSAQEVSNKIIYQNRMNKKILEGSWEAEYQDLIERVEKAAKRLAENEITKIDHDVVMGKLKLLGKSDDQIREIFKDVGLTSEAADCFIKDCKSTKQLTDKEREALLTIVSSPTFKGDAVFVVNRPHLINKLKLSGKSDEEIEKLLRLAGVKEDEIQCIVDRCKQALQLTTEELDAISDSLETRNSDQTTIAQIGSKERAASKANNSKIKAFIQKHPDLFKIYKSIKPNVDEQKAARLFEMQDPKNLKKFMILNRGVQNAKSADTKINEEKSNDNDPSEKEDRFLAPSKNY